MKYFVFFLIAMLVLNSCGSKSEEETTTFAEFQKETENIFAKQDSIAYAYGVLLGQNIMSGWNRKSDFPVSSLIQGLESDKKNITPETQSLIEGFITDGDSSKISVNKVATYISNQSLYEGLKLMESQGVVLIKSRVIEGAKDILEGNSNILLDPLRAKAFLERNL
jgi:hypothetical protein